MFKHYMLHKYEDELTLLTFRSSTFYMTNPKGLSREMIQELPLIYFTRGTITALTWKRVSEKAPGPLFTITPFSNLKQVYEA